MLDTYIDEQEVEQPKIGGQEQSDYKPLISRKPVIYYTLTISISGWLGFQPHYCTKFTLSLYPLAIE